VGDRYSRVGQRGSLLKGDQGVYTFSDLFIFQGDTKKEKRRDEKGHHGNGGSLTRRQENIQISKRFGQGVKWRT